MANKVTSIRGGGLEAPRNSLELPVETLGGLYAGRNNNLQSSEKNYYFNEAPIKKFISAENCRRSNDRPNAPSIVARLMGLDMLPFDSGQSKMTERKNRTSAGKLMDNERWKNGSVGCDLSMPNSSLQLDSGSFDHDFDSYSYHCNSPIKLKNPKPQEHPQEEELQKFKKEFEAWQAARVKECSEVVDFGNAPSQLIAQDELNREKMFLYANSKRITTERLMEPKDLSRIPGPHEMLISANCEQEKDYLLAGLKRYPNGRSRTDFRSSELMNSDQKFDIVSVPTKIVILRPGPDWIGVSEDSWNTTPSALEEKGNVEVFLEEVKERLKSELQGKSSKRSTIARRGGMDSSYWEKPSEPRQIAHHIAQVRDTVTRNLGMNLLHSESTRSYTSDSQLNGTGSPEFINGYTRRLLAERLRDVLKDETHQKVPMFSYKRRSSVLGCEKLGARQSRDIWIDDKMGCSESCSNAIEKQSRSFKQDSRDSGMHHKELSPRNLVRSLSAPVSGMSFGELLLEDHHILTGAHISRKHEVVENMLMDTKKPKKDKFNIREKISSFRYSLTLKGRLFHRRVQSVEELHYNKHDFFKDITSEPTVTMSFYETHENSTEVPPSPASVCSNVCDEFWRSADYSSPTPSGVHQLEDSETPHTLSQINSNLNDLWRKLNQLQCTGLEETMIEEEPHEVEIDIEDPAEAYIKTLLVASGLYNGSADRFMSKWDPFGKPISNQVFEEVEESYRQSKNVDESCIKDHEVKLHHEMILDLLNEALLAILRHPIGNSRYMGKIIDPVHEPPCGRKLLFHIWEIIRIYVYPPADRSYYTLQNMLVQELKANLWSRLMDDDINTLSIDLECQIINDLIEEMVKDMNL